MELTICCNNWPVVTTMSEQALLLAECRNFTRYLIDVDPDDYVCDSYLAANKVRHDELTPQTGFDRLLLTIARKHRLLTRAVDVYARFFAHASAVRRRLVTLLAIIESNASTVERLEHPDYEGPTGFIIGLAWRSAVLAILLLIAIVTLLPVQLLSGGMKRNPAS